MEAVVLHRSWTALVELVSIQLFIVSLKILCHRVRRVILREVEVAGCVVVGAVHLVKLRYALIDTSAGCLDKGRLLQLSEQNLVQGYKVVSSFSCD